MTTETLSAYSIHELGRLIHAGEVSSRQLVESCLAATDKFDPQLNAFAFVDADNAINQAIELDAMRDHGKWLGPLHGVPVAVKDNYLVNGMPTTACSQTRDKKQGTRDSAVVAKLKASGAVIFGKTNMHEWAYGATNKISREGRVKNPWDTRRISGGSSGGSAVALAAGLVPAALGSDTGGSIRIPASACGVCGLKPTFGRISTDGVLPLSWSMDVAGPMARSVNDLAVMYDAIKQDTCNSSHSNRGLMSGRDLWTGLGHDLSGLKVAVLKGERLEHSNEVGKTFDAALQVLQSNGVKVSSVRVDTMVDGFSAWDTILHVEATTYHSAALEENAELFSENVRNHLEAGKYIPATNYVKAHQYRQFFNGLIAEVFVNNHIIVLPTLPITAPLADNEQVQFSNVSVSSQDAMTYLAWLANFTYLPALSIPCGNASDGMPVGMSLIGPAGSDKHLLRLGSAIQSMTDWHKEKPRLNDSL